MGFLVPVGRVTDICVMEVSGTDLRMPGMHLHQVIHQDHLDLEIFERADGARAYDRLLW